MLQSFYKYLSALLIEFFRTNAIEPGNKYHLIIEDKAKRQSLLNSLKQQSCAEELSISNIYQYNSLLGNIEEPYDTFYLAVGSHNPKLLIGDSDSANDDYLATLRNAVGVHGRPLENYAILFILSSNRIESLTTASVNLLKKGMPLYFDNIQRSIRTQIDANIINECEREYLYQYLDQLSSSVGDGRSSLFDLEDILAIVQDKSLKKSFSRIGYIEDDQIYGITFDKRGRALTDYIHDNADYFRQIQEIMSSNTLEEERPEKLSKFLDDKLVDDIIKWGTEKWKDELTYSMLLKSVFRKQSQEVLTYEGAEFKGHCLSNLYLISRGSSSSNKKGTFSIIVCDPRETETTEIQLAFNKGIRELVKGEGFQTNGRFLNLSLTDAVTRISVGEDNNIFKFVITRIKTKPETFRDIANCFTIKASGDIVVNIPEDYSTIRFGYGTTQIDLGVSTIEWLEDYSLLIPIEDEITNASIKFGNKTVKFILKMDSKKIVPISPEKIFEKIWMEKATFKNSNKSDFESQPYYKICWGEEEFSTYEKHRYYLLLEKQMIDNDIYYLKKQVTAFGTQFVQDDDFCIPDAITETLKPLFKYFRDNNCLPSLTYLDPTLSSLYEQYLQSVLTVISCIPTNRSLTREEYYLTRLGVVEQEDIIALHVERSVEGYLVKLMKDIDEIGHGLILLIGSAGDGKSHLMSSIKQDYPALADNFHFYNDATESYSPNCSSIETLKKVLASFQDESIDSSTEKYVLAINLGKLNAFIDDEYNKSHFTRLIDLVSCLFDDDLLTTGNTVQNGPIRFIDFSCQQMFEMVFDSDKDYPVTSKFLRKLLEKITKPASDNPFYFAYKNSVVDGVHDPIVVNYRILQKKSTQNTIIKLIIESIVRFKLIVTPRDFLDFISCIIVYNGIEDYKPRVDYFRALLPSLLYENSGNNILESISKLDPLKFSSTEHNLDLATLFTSSEPPADYLTDDLTELGLYDKIKSYYFPVNLVSLFLKSLLEERVVFIQEPFRPGHRLHHPFDGTDGLHDCLDAEVAGDFFIHFDIVSEILFGARAGDSVPLADHVGGDLCLEFTDRNVVPALHPPIGTCRRKVMAEEMAELMAERLHPLQVVRLLVDAD